MDQELPEDEALRIQQHVHRCSDCRSEFESLSYAYELVENGIARIEASDRIWEGIKNEIGPGKVVDLTERRTRRASRFSRYWLPAVAAAAAVLVLALIGPVLRQNSFPHEQRFASFMAEREAQMRQRIEVLQRRSLDDRHQPRTNPFMQPVSHLNGNPFSEE